MRALLKVLALTSLLLPLAIPAAETPPTTPPIAVPAPAAPANAAGGDDRAVAYREFRTAFDAAEYKTALPLASRVVEITQSEFGAEAPEMGNALSNLATTYYRMKEYGMALDNYRAALTVLDLTGDATDPRLVRPLQGMGTTLLAMDRGPEALAPLKRAVDILRNRDGLHNAGQLPVLKVLIAAYVATDRLEDAGREQEYAVTVAETAFGKDDLRMLPVLEQQARWYESTGRYTAARIVHTRAVQLADAAKPNGLEAVPGLRGIARCFRLGFINGENDESIATATSELPATMGSTAVARALTLPSTEGERALRIALARLGSSPERAGTRGAVLVDLGDWYYTADKSARAMETWRDAWRELSAAGDTSLLDKPVAIIYLPPAIATSRRLRQTEDFAAETVQLRLVIAADGDVQEATVANPVPAHESAERSVMTAARRAHWRPAFRNGQPIMVSDYLFSEEVFVKRPKTGD
jgi:tetratricopeptide (TPR) repeat protein